MSDSLEESTIECPALSINEDVAARIWIHLEQKELAAALMTCKTWHNLLKDDEALWEAQYAEEWPSAAPDFNNGPDVAPLLEAKAYYKLFQLRKQLDTQTTECVDQLLWPNPSGTQALLKLEEFGYLNVKDQLQRLAKCTRTDKLGLKYWAQQGEQELRARYCASQLPQLITENAPPEQVALLLANAIRGRDNAWVLQVLDQLAEECRRRIEETNTAEGLESLKVVNTVMFGPMWLGIHLNYQENGYVVGPNHGFGIFLQANSNDFFDPRNSFLDCVIERRMGIPITMCIAYKAVCDRLGIKVDLLKLPGQVMLHYGEPGAEEERWIDCFSRGRMLDRRIAHGLFMEREGIDITQPFYMAPMTAREIAVRMLNNLMVSYQRALANPVRDRSMRVVFRLLLTLEHPEALAETLGPNEYLPMQGQDAVNMIAQATAGGSLSIDSQFVAMTVGATAANYKVFSSYWMQPRPPFPPSSQPSYSIGQVVKLRLTPGYGVGGFGGDRAVIIMMHAASWGTIQSLVSLPTLVLDQATANFNKPPVLPVLSTQVSNPSIGYTILRESLHAGVLEPYYVSESGIEGEEEWSVARYGHIHVDCGKYFQGFCENTGRYIPNKWLHYICPPYDAAKQ